MAGIPLTIRVHLLTLSIISLNWSMNCPDSSDINLNIIGNSAISIDNFLHNTYEDMSASSDT